MGLPWTLPAFVLGQPKRGSPFSYVPKRSIAQHTHQNIKICNNHNQQNTSFNTLFYSSIQPFEFFIHLFIHVTKPYSFVFLWILKQL